MNMRWIFTILITFVVICTGLKIDILNDYDRSVRSPFDDKIGFYDGNPISQWEIYYAEKRIRGYNLSVKVFSIKPCGKGFASDISTRAFMEDFMSEFAVLDTVAKYIFAEGGCMKHEFKLTKRINDKMVKEYNLPVHVDIKKNGVIKEIYEIITEKEEQQKQQQTK